MNMPLKKPEGLNWNAASVELPEIPMLPAGQDALSATISAVLPTLAASLAANVATLQAKETMFSGKLGAAQAAYQNSDDAGSQSVGQIVGVLGQVGQQAGQLGQSAGAPAQAIGGQTGMFGSLMQQAMQAAQGGGGDQSPGGQDAGGAAPGGATGTGAAGGAGPSPAGAVGQQTPRDNAVDARDEQPTQAHESQREEREPLQRAEANDRAMAGPSASEDGRHGPAPVKSPEHQVHRGDEDLGRRM
jgi:PE family